VEFEPHCARIILIIDIAVGLCSNVACCMLITLRVQYDMVDFAWGSVARSVSVSRYTC